MSVDQRAFYVSMSKSFLNKQNIFGLMKKHCCVEVPQHMESYSVNSWILQFYCVFIYNKSSTKTSTRT